MSYWWLIPLGYLAGSVPWGLLIVRATRGVDVRSYGSGRTGMTNVMRVGGRWPALAVLVADAGKGIALVAVARVLTPDAWLHALVASSVIMGHVWPIFAGFRGGRGIATGLGTAGALDIWAVSLGVVVFVPVVAATRFVSLGSVLSVVTVVIAFGVRVEMGQTPAPYLPYALGMGALILWMHRANIRRLLARTEARLGDASQ